jgi:hypothetical protein
MLLMVMVMVMVMELVMDDGDGDDDGDDTDDSAMNLSLIHNLKSLDVLHEYIDFACNKFWQFLSKQ